MEDYRLLRWSGRSDTWNGIGRSPNDSFLFDDGPVNHRVIFIGRAGITIGMQRNDVHAFVWCSEPVFFTNFETEDVTFAQFVFAIRERCNTVAAIDDTETDRRMGMERLVNASREVQMVQTRITQTRRIDQQTVRTAI